VPRGFSLVEVLVATAVVAVATLGLAQLLVMSVHTNRVSRFATVTTVLAFQKMEQLQSMSGEEVRVAPSGALAVNTAGWFDTLDESGRVLETVLTGAVFVRRWSVDPLPLPDTVMLQVRVIPFAARGWQGSSGHPEEGRIAAIKRLPPPLRDPS
jgi:prepilin-type N-terminal cleavage/methylation domain-containing protein